MKKIVFLSDKESYLGFKLIGIETAIASDKDSALKYLNGFKKNQEVGIILIADTISSFIKKEVTDILLSKEGPLIFEVPSIKDYEKQRKGIKDFLKETIGMGI